MSYLHPSQRTGVMGPSGGKTQYHCATLLGNWNEDRQGFGNPPIRLGTDAIAKDTTYLKSYKGTTSYEELAGAKPPGCFCAEAPKELLFYHGDVANPQKNRYTIQELSYRNPHLPPGEGPLELREILDKEGVSDRFEKTASIHRSLGTRNSTIDGKQMQGSFNGTGTQSSLPDKVMQQSNKLRSLCGSVKRNDSVMSQLGNSEYVPPSLPPLGRVAEKERLQTTKNVTVDLTGEYLYDHPENYPMTSSVCIGPMMDSRNNPMHKTDLRLRVEGTYM